MREVGHLERLRSAELQAAVVSLRGRKRVLDLGSGSGWQAAELQRGGFRVTAVDVARSAVPYYPVLPYDGSRLPFRDGAFDAVFSSNVLEHVACLDDVFREVRRVLTDGGIAIHVLPTPTWRIVTSLTHYPYVVRSLWRHALRTRDQSTEPKTGWNAEASSRPGLLRLLRRAITPGSHGEFPTAMHEVVAYQRTAWTRRFEAAGFSVKSSAPAGIFYTGSRLLPGLSIGTRRRAARIMGSACRVYVMDVAAPPTGVPDEEL